LSKQAASLFSRKSHFPLTFTIVTLYFHCKTLVPFNNICRGRIKSRTQHCHFTCKKVFFGRNNMWTGFTRLFERNSSRRRKLWNQKPKMPIPGVFEEPIF